MAKKKAPKAVETEEEKKASVEEHTVIDMGETAAVIKDPAGNPKELEKLLTQMETRFGAGCIVKAEDYTDVEKVPTGILLQDILMKGGLPKSSIVLKYGEYSSGKTLTTLYEASVFTKQGIPVLYVDAEHSFDKTWAVKLGNDPKYFHLSQPPDLEKAVDIVDIAVRSKQFGMVIFDSLTAAIPNEAIEKSAYDAQMALQARINSKLCQKVTSGLQPANLKDPNSYNNTIVIFISHLKLKVGVVYGNPETIPGGKAITFHASYVNKYSKGQVIKIGDDAVGQEIRIWIQKAKHSKPYVGGVTEFYFDPPRINNAKTMLVYATQTGVIERAGAFYTYKEIKAQGVSKLVMALKDKPEYLKEIKQAIIEKMG